MSVAALGLLLVLSGGALLVIAGEVAEARRLSRTEQPTAPGQIVRLPQGRTHLRWDGPEGGPAVVCVHGLSTPLQIYDPLVARLTAAGYRVLRYDHLGRGQSAAPPLRHDAAFYTKHLSDVLDAAGVAGPVPLIGYSMGGAVVTAFADAHPERCAGLCLLAAAGLRDGPTGLYAIGARLPVIGDALWSLLAPGMLLRSAQTADLNALPDFPGIVAAEVGRRGTLPAQLSSMRHLLATRQDAVHRRLAERGVPVLAVWGGEDVVIPVVSSTRLEQANPAAQQAILPDAGHELAASHADDVANAVRPWLESLGNAPRG